MTTLNFATSTPDESVGNMSGNLPHWRQTGTTYFVTFRLGDSIPRAKLEQWEREREEWLAAHSEPHDARLREEFYVLFIERFQKWLDAGYGSCVLSKPHVGSIVEEALRFSDGERYALGEHIVMPNHVHALVTPLPGYDLSTILQTWKSYSSHQINHALGRRGGNWQKESFDHIVRNGRQLKRIVEYIRNNPKMGQIEQAGE
ncbi:MAG: transposase [Candidatus Hydrogenedentes bacterium]|nr:transposase [Candidatus Hydrogenedentota bacterium]